MADPREEPDGGPGGSAPRDHRNELILPYPLPGSLRKSTPPRTFPIAALLPCLKKLKKNIVASSHYTGSPKYDLY